jgi:hypothetical protein
MHRLREREREVAKLFVHGLSTDHDLRRSRRQSSDSSISLRGASREAVLVHLLPDIANENDDDKRPPRRTYLFVSSAEPLAAAEAAWSAPTPIDLCIMGPSDEARDAARFACAGRPVRMDAEPLLGARRPDESDLDLAARQADAFRALYALDTRAALVIWDDNEHASETPLLVDEQWLLRRAELIERELPLP